jgi:hypothetical protein
MGASLRRILWRTEGSWGLGPAPSAGCSPRRERGARREGEGEREGGREGERERGREGERERGRGPCWAGPGRAVSQGGARRCRQPTAHGARGTCLGLSPAGHPHFAIANPARARRRGRRAARPNRAARDGGRVGAAARRTPPAPPFPGCAQCRKELFSAPFGSGAPRRRGPRATGRAAVSDTGASHRPRLALRPGPARARVTVTVAAPPQARVWRRVRRRRRRGMGRRRRRAGRGCPGGG